MPEKRKGKAKRKTRRSAEAAYRAGQEGRKARPAAGRSKAVRQALKREPKGALRRALAKQARSAARRRRGR